MCCKFAFLRKKRFSIAFFSNTFSDFLKKYFIYLFSERGEGREKERERNISVWLPLTPPLLGTWPATQTCALTGNRTGDPSVCRWALNPLSDTSQGPFLTLKSRYLIPFSYASFICPVRTSVFTSVSFLHLPTRRWDILLIFISLFIDVIRDGVLIWCVKYWGFFSHHSSNSHYNDILLRS